MPTYLTAPLDISVLPTSALVMHTLCSSSTPQTQPALWELSIPIPCSSRVLQE